MNINEMQEILDSYSSMEWEPFSDDGQAYIDAESYGLEFDEGFGIWVNSKGRADVVYGLDGVSYSHDTNDLHIKDAINMAEDLTEGLLL